ncbi:cytochrome b561 [Hasllibacter halocynthiae]|uniref:Cytochrome b561 n=1 Tax=Hasllibacter halocynthiae TaxID=595589 RepID=A0A2T0X482_9RHOB|nr:cytochrome b/b6 domain-containing protein [Hasllibacter halocynthiae]PRY93727.1 cytochrome b561 [Hasllibacter halocynthiae]
MTAAADLDDTKHRTDRVPGRYHSSQRALHWLVVVLVVFQFLTGGQMEAAFLLRDVQPLNLAGPVWVHGTIGLSILAAMLGRAGLRARYGAPPPPSDEPRPVQWLSRGTHYAFYVVLILMPIAGLVAVLSGNPTIAWAHGVTAYVLLALAALHVAGALWHAFKRDGVATRMLGRDPAEKDMARTD